MPSDNSIHEPTLAIGWVTMSAETPGCMFPAGYMAKKVASRPEWLKAEVVVDLYSVSGCVSEYFCDYIRHWKHNGFWLFDSPAEIASVATAESLDLSDQRIFYYEVYESQFDGDRKAWQSFRPDDSFKTGVKPPESRKLEGFDVVTFSVQTSPECSPLSCNGLAESMAVNQHCLLPSLEEAIRLMENGAFENSEPGPFRIFAVYACNAA
jgi:hypothetical protein